MRIKPKKRLGQNFLIDRNIQEKIVQLCELRPCDIVLEIGSGRGELTEAIAKRVKQVLAFEIDHALCEILKKNLEGYSNVTIFNRDFLKFNLKGYLARQKIRTKVVGNIPYYISSPIVESIVDGRERIDAIFLTVQKEFARRMIALAGTKVYGAFSCFVQYYFKTEIILNINKACFSPVPKVDSSLVRLAKWPVPQISPKDEKKFFKIIRQAFNYRRKTLRNSLSGLVPASKLESFFQSYGIDSNTRPERLTLQDFASLSNI